MKTAALRFRGHSSRSTAVLFLGLAAVSVAALAWTAVRFVRRDLALEARQLGERREAAADRVAAALEQVLSAEERRLSVPFSADFDLPAGQAVLLFGRSSELDVRPESGLLFYPEPASGREAPERAYAEAERLEFRDKDYRRASAELRRLARAEDAAVRVGAQLRLARNLRKANNPEAALGVYAEMADSPARGISFSGVPADLAARHARCVLLEELGRGGELREDALRLEEGLRSGRWRLDRESYLYYRGEAARRLGRELGDGDERQALAEAAIWLWRNRPAPAGADRGSSGRRALRRNGASVVLLWRISGENLAALIAGPGYQRSRWFDPTMGGLAFSDFRVGLRDADRVPVYGKEPVPGEAVTSRLASVTGLPWDIAVVNADPEAVSSQFAQRRRMMAAGLGLLALLVIAASYFIGRAVSRELAAARLQSDFVSAVSHEFRTPLTSMRQFTEMLVEDESLPAEKRRAFHRAQERATRRLSRLVESLLDFGRMEAGARPYRLERLDAGRLVKSVVEEFRQESGVHGLTMECAVPEEGAPINADTEALGQALWNLLDNAVKYSGDGPTVRVEVEAGAQVAIRVLDRGVGIPPSERKRIFRKFVRGSSAGKAGVKGTGIGLAMVKHIVDAHGGKILVAVAPGGGSAFTIVLPTGG